MSLYHGQGAQRVRLKGVHQACRAYTYNKTDSCPFKGETNIKLTEIPTRHAAKTVSRLWLVKKMGHFYVYNSPPGDWPLPRRRVAGAGIHNPGQCLSQRGEPLPGIAKATFVQYRGQIYNPGQCLAQRGEPLPGIAKTTFVQRTEEESCDCFCVCAVCYWGVLCNFFLLETRQTSD